MERIERGEVNNFQTFKVSKIGDKMSYRTEK